jgi:hypothetical protein
VRKPLVRARYSYADAGEPTVGGLVREWWSRGAARRAHGS